MQCVSIDRAFGPTDRRLLSSCFHLLLASRADGKIYKKEKKKNLFLVVTYRQVYIFQTEL